MPAGFVLLSSGSLLVGIVRMLRIRALFYPLSEDVL